MSVEKIKNRDNQAKPPTIQSHRGKTNEMLKNQYASNNQQAKNEIEHNIRQNYIANFEQHYDYLQQNIQKISKYRSFQTFIPRKNKYDPQQIAEIVTKYCPKPSKQKKRQSSFNKNSQNTEASNQQKKEGLSNKSQQSQKKQSSFHQNNQYLQIELQKLELELPFSYQPKKGQYNSVRRQKSKLRRKHHLNDINEKQNSSQTKLIMKQLVTQSNEGKYQQASTSNPYEVASKYYVDELIKNFMARDSLIREHLFSSMYYLQMLKQYDKTQLYHEGVYIPAIDNSSKFTIVFDLDETLVHCNDDDSQPYQVALSVSFSGFNTANAYLNIRPHAREILEQLSLQFEIIVFTASHETYANAVLDYLDPENKFIKHRLYRQHCIYIDQGYYVKDLRILGRDLARVVLVDNAAYSYCFQIDNGVPIIPYYHAQDFQLLALKNYLISLKKQSDVRRRNRQFFKLQEYNKFSDLQDLVKNLYLT